MCRKAWLNRSMNYDFEVRKLGNDTACGNVSKFIMKQFVFLHSYEIYYDVAHKQTNGS